jgi:hypothetical protein
MHESKRVVLASKFATEENWSRTNSEQDLVRARTRDLSMVCSCLRFARCPRQTVHEFRSMKSRPCKAPSSVVSSLRSPLKVPSTNGTQA